MIISKRKYNSVMGHVWDKALQLGFEMGIKYKEATDRDVGAILGVGDYKATLEEVERFIKEGK